MQIPPGASPPLPNFPPSTPPISVWHRHTPQKNPSFHTLSPWLHSNGDVANLVASYDTPMDCTNCYLSCPINNPHAGPRASMQAMAGLRWASAPAVLKSSEYHNWRNPGYSHQICSTSTYSLIQYSTTERVSPWFSPFLLSRDTYVPKCVRAR